MKQEIVRHLSTEELLLLADGELTGSQSEHFDGCVECQERLGALQGELTTVSSALSATLQAEDNSAQSWARLERAMAEASAAQDLHLSPEELLLLLDGELSSLRAGHAGRCAGCGSAHSDVRRLLWDVESELRALVPSEPLERRLAAEQALKQHLYPVVPAKVIEFPVRRWTRYAAAAALLISALAGYQMWNQTPQAEEPVITAQAVSPSVPAVRADVPQEIEPQTLIAPSAAPIAAPAPVERFAEITAFAAAPVDAAIVADAPAMQLARFEAPALGLELGRLPAVSAPRQAEPVQHAAVPELVPGAVGGLVRTALVEHYRDAARRSFQTVDAPALDGEIARYVSDVFRSQSDLIGHVYELDQLLNAPIGALQADQVRLHLRGALNSEAVIYDHLSEALPRRYWRYQGEESDGASTNDLRAESKALLQDVLGLERTLTTVLTGSRQTVGLEEADSSSGELLRRIHQRLSRIKDLTRSAL